MDPNPYQSPQHAGYDPPRPARVPLWRRIAMLIVTCLGIFFGSFITIGYGMALLDFCRWLGF